MDKLEFLDSPEGEKDEVQSVPAEPKAEPPEAPQPEGQPRDEHGRYKGKEQEQQQPEAEAPAPPPPPAEPPKEEPVMVPLAALHETRDKVKALEAQLAGFRQPPQPQPEPPDPILDPEGFAQFQSRQFDEQRYTDNLYWSRQFAEQKHGAETVEAAVKWGFEKCEADPHFNAAVRASRDPIGLVVSHYSRDQIASQVTPDEFKAFQAWKAAQAAAQQQPAAPAAPPPPPAPPQSIASAPSAGGMQHQAVGEGVAFDETFRK